MPPTPSLVASAHAGASHSVACAAAAIPADATDVAGMGFACAGRRCAFVLHHETHFELAQALSPAVSGDEAVAEAQDASTRALIGYYREHRR